MREQGKEDIDESDSVLNLHVQAAMVKLDNTASKSKYQSTQREPSNMLVFWTLSPSPSNQQLTRTNKCQHNSSLERCIDVILPEGTRWNCSISGLFITPAFKYSYGYRWIFLSPIALNEVAKVGDLVSILQPSKNSFNLARMLFINWLTVKHSHLWNVDNGHLSSKGYFPPLWSNGCAARRKTTAAGKTREIWVKTVWFPSPPPKQREEALRRHWGILVLLVCSVFQPQLSQSVVCFTESFYLFLPLSFPSPVHPFAFPSCPYNSCT